MSWKITSQTHAGNVFFQGT